MKQTKVTQNRKSLTCWRVPCFSAREPHNHKLKCVRTAGIYFR